MNNLIISKNVYELDLSNQNLTELPDLSKTIINTLNCSNNQLTSLDGRLPPNIKSLNCSHNKLTSLPELPFHMGNGNLNCSHNQLTSIQRFPFGLEQINCSHNQLTSLPELQCPNGSSTLYLFNCSHNKITSLHNFHAYYEIYLLNCSHNKLSSLPELTRVKQINCSYNQLTSLPIPIYNESTMVICFNNNLTLKNIPENYINIQYNIQPTLITIKKINKFKYLYYSLKFKSKFYKLLKKIRERKYNKLKYNNLKYNITIILIIITQLIYIYFLSKMVKHLSFYHVAHGT